MIQPNPIIVDMEVVANNVPVQMGVATQYDLPIDLETLQATANGDYTAPAGVAWDKAHVEVSVPTGTINIDQNGTYDVTEKASAVVNVPNSYSAQDEGKVVQDGTLVGQTARTVTESGTYDTTTNNSLKVDIPNELTVECNRTSLQNQFASDSFSPSIDHLHIVGTYQTQSAYSCNSVAEYISGVKKVTLTTVSKPTSLGLSFRYSYFDEICLDVDTSLCTNFSTCFMITTHTTKVTGTPINLSSVTTSSNVTNLVGGYISDIRFVPNTLSVSMNIKSLDSSTIVNAALVSIANCLVAGLANVLTLSTGTKNRLGNILGEVSEGLFVENESGTLSLMDFITNVKGWTVA